MNQNNSNNNNDIGIVAMECHFPKQFVSQTSLENDNMKSDPRIKPGKYTIGLGQTEMAFCSDREDIYTMALTCVNNLITKYKINKKDIGRVTVSTETIMDHSKSIKSVLMQLFESDENEESTDIEGVDMVHACYSGTAALLDGFYWCHSPYWDGRYSIVIACDIAEYSKGNARPTGGAGCVALLIGKNGIIKLTKEDGLCKSSHSKHGYDFYKPNLNSPYPVVDGHHSNSCYLDSLDHCYQLVCKKYKSLTGNNFDFKNDVNSWIFHSPYNKLVQTSFARLVYNEWFNQKNNNNDDLSYFSTFVKSVDELFTEKDIEKLKEIRNMTREESMNDRASMKLFEKISKQLYKEKVIPSTYLPKRVGNCYSASIFMGLMSLIHIKGSKLTPIIDNNGNKKCHKIGLFSYGSGICSTMYCLTVDNSNINYCESQLKLIKNLTDIDTRLNNRIERSAEYFNQTMDKRHALHDLEFGNESKLTDDVNETIFENGFYLTKIDGKKQRFHEQFIIDPVKDESESETNKITDENKVDIDNNDTKGTDRNDNNRYDDIEDVIKPTKSNGEIRKFIGDMPVTKSIIANRMDRMTNGRLGKLAERMANGDDVVIQLTREAVRMAPRADQCYN